MNNRNATASMNGYTYQRKYALYYLFQHETINILEEGEEDIDISTKNGSVFIQIKYHDKSSIESLTIDSGLMKVIKAHYKKSSDQLENIHEIKYMSYNGTFTKELDNMFNNKQYEKIGQHVYHILVNNFIEEYYSEKNKNKKKIKRKTEKLTIKQISEEKNCEKYYENDLEIINNDKLYKNKDGYKNMKIFLDKNFCELYFGKFILDNKMKNYEELENYILEEINNKFKILFNETNLSDVKQKYIYYKLYDTLVSKMFKKETDAINKNDLFEMMNKKLEENTSYDKLLGEIFENITKNDYWKIDQMQEILSNKHEYQTNIKCLFNKSCKFYDKIQNNYNQCKEYKKIILLLNNIVWKNIIQLNKDYDCKKNKFI